MDGLFEVLEPTQEQALILDNRQLATVKIEPLMPRIVAGEHLTGQKLDIQGLVVEVRRSEQRGKKPVVD